MVAYLSFLTIYKKNERVKQYQEDFFLLKKGLSNTKNEFGFAKEEYVPIQQIHGIIQKPQEQQMDFKGEESNPMYTGYFLPEFILNTSEVADYRIKYIRPHETLILKIDEYNPNLFLKGKRDHIQLELILEKKYEGD
jgi:hypothetical protein